MAKQFYSLQQISEKGTVLTDREAALTKGGYKNIPTSGAGSYGWVTWETVDIRRPGDLQEPEGISRINSAPLG